MDTKDLMTKAAGQVKPTDKENAGNVDKDAQSKRVALTNPQAAQVAEQARMDYHLVRRMFPAPGASKAPAPAAGSKAAA